MCCRLPVEVNAEPTSQPSTQARDGIPTAAAGSAALEPRLRAHDRPARRSIRAINASMVEIDRKFAGVISDAGIMISNSASTASIRSTMSIELRPASVSWSSTDTGREIEFFARICVTSSTNRALRNPVLRSNISLRPESSTALKGYIGGTV